MPKTSDNIFSAVFEAFMMLKSGMSFKSDFYQLPMNHMETLKLIHQKRSVPMKEVAKFLAITPPSATVMIQHLVESGYVGRHSIGNDRRSICLSLTKKGQDTLQKALKERYKDYQKLLSNLSEPERHQLLYILKKMVSHNN